MKRDFLKDLGLEADIINKIMAENGSDIQAAKGEADDLKQQLAAKDTEISGLKDQIAQRDSDIETLKASAVDSESLKTQLSDLQTKYNTDTEALNQKLKDQKTEFETTKAIESFFADVQFSSHLAKEAAIAQFKAKQFKLVDGTFQGGKEWLEELRTSSPDAFKASEDPNSNGGRQPYFTKNQNTGANPASGGNTSPNAGATPFGGWGFQQVRNFDNK